MNFLSEIRSLAAENDLVRNDPEQIRLSEMFLVPAIDEVMELHRGVRKAVDLHIRANLPTSTSTVTQNVPWIRCWENYPQGFCNVITDSVLSSTEEIMFNRENIPWSPHRSGLLYKDVYGIMDNQYFQHAIQFGDFVINVANDASDVNDTPVIIHRTNDIVFENMNSYDRYAETAEKYWKVEVYPNVYFPLMAACYPFIVVDANGRIRFEMEHANIVFKDFWGDLSRAERFIFHGNFSEKRLPEKYRRLLQKEAKKHGDWLSYEEEYLSEKSILWLARKVKKESPEEAEEFLRKVFVTSQKLGKILDSAVLMVG